MCSRAEVRVWKEELASCLRKGEFVGVGAKSASIEKRLCCGDDGGRKRCEGLLCNAVVDT